MHCKPSRLRLALAAAGLLAGPAVLAQPAASLPAIEVTARPVVEDVAVDAYGATSAVVTQDQLRDQNAVDLASALRRTPGVQVSRYNPVGAFGGDQGGAVFIRGMGVSRPGSEIKTYVDGIPFYMGLWNHPLLDLLPVNGMQSITVYKSPQPQRSGNNFAAIDLRTRRATEDGVHGDVRLSAGSFGTLTEQINLLGRQGDLDWSFSQGHAQSDGHRDNAEGKLNNAMGRIAYRLDAHWSLAANFLTVDNRARDPGDARQPAAAVAPRYDTQATMLGATLSHRHGDWRGELKLYSNHGDGDWLDQPAPDGDNRNHFTMRGLRWQEQFSPWQGGTVTAGLDHDRIGGRAIFDRVAPAPQGRFDAPGFRITSPYVALQQQVPLNADWTLQPSAGLRWYAHNMFDSEVAPHAGVALVSEQLTVFANLARGVNYPGLEAPLLSSLIPPLADSWRQLSAEALDHAEIGFKWTPTAHTQVDASLFHDRVKNRYVFGFPPEVPPPPQFINLGRYTVRGAELSVRQDVARGWSVFAGLTLLDPGLEDLPYAPRRALSLGLNGRAGPLRLAMDAQLQSSVRALNRQRAAGAQNTERVAGFGVVNARVAYPVPALGRQGEVFVALENILDRDYAYRPGYPMPGRSAQLGLVASF